MLIDYIASQSEHHMLIDGNEIHKCDFPNLYNRIVVKAQVFEDEDGNSGLRLKGGIELLK